MDNSFYIPLNKSQVELLKKYNIKTFEDLIVGIQKLHDKHLKLNERLTHIKSTLKPEA